MNYRELYELKKGGLSDCLNLIESGDNIVCAADCNEPVAILNELHTIRDRVTGITLKKGRNGMYKFQTEPGMDGHINSIGYFFGNSFVIGQQYGNCSFVPTDIPDFPAFSQAVKPYNTFMASVSPMDENGDFCVGLAMQWTEELYRFCSKVILEVNPKLPRVKGGLLINIKDVTRLLEVDYDILHIPASETTEEEIKVAQYCRELMRDGDCIQLGIGSLPNAIAEQMYDLKELGLHTEMITSSMGEMIRRGVITGTRKNIHIDEHIGTFAIGDDALYETLATNPKCRIMRGSYVVDPFVIMQNDNMVSINTAIEMDLTGQINAETLGAKQFSGVGGGFDFVYGALHSKGGRSIYAFTSKSKKGFSKISTLLAHGSTVSIPRSYTDYIVTEYGIAPLRGRTVRQRSENLIAIAHPDFRAELRRDAEKLHYI